MRPITKSLLRWSASQPFFVLVTQRSTWGGGLRDDTKKGCRPDHSSSGHYKKHSFATFNIALEHTVVQHNLSLWPYIPISKKQDYFT